MIKRKSHVGLNIVFSLEDKLHMFAPPCNILFILRDLKADFILSDTPACLFNDFKFLVTDFKFGFKI